MQRKRIYVDSCVLIAAFQAVDPNISDAAIEILENPEHEILYSGITELETIPKPIFFKRDHEAKFYQEVFDHGVRVNCSVETIDSALEVARQNGLSAGDALHLACAIQAAADELVTSEKSSRLPSAPRPGIAIRTIRRA